MSTRATSYIVEGGKVRRKDGRELAKGEGEAVLAGIKGREEKMKKVLQKKPVVVAPKPKAKDGD